MSEQPDINGAALHEQFVNDCLEMDMAWAEGRFDEWLQERIADERLAAGIDSAA